MKKIGYLLCIIGVSSAIMLLSSGCEKESHPGTDGNNGNITGFDFATTANYELDVNYNLPSDYDIYFEVYSENPVDQEGNKRTDISPLFKGITEKGKFTTQANESILNMPTAVEEVYFYTGSIGAPAVVKVPVQGNKIVMNTISPALKSSATRSNATFTSTIPGAQKLGDWNESGVPAYLGEKATISAEFLKDINYTLPSAKSVPVRHPEYLKEGVPTNINLIKKTAVDLTFVHSGASLSNVIGYFCYQTANPPTSKSDVTTPVIALPYASINVLNSGDKIRLKYWNGTGFEDEFPAGTSIGWVLYANGFRNGNVTTGLNTYYSFPEFNIENNKSNKQHNILFFDKKNSTVVLAFEDVNRESNSCDNDFHDAILQISVTNEGAINGDDYVQLEEWKDSDGDGVHDDEDEFPNDKDISFSIHYPQKGVYGSLAFEDLWPYKGDYDMNDLIVYYNSIFYMGHNKIHHSEDNILIMNAGAGIRSGFGYQLGVANDQVKKVVIESAYSNSDMTPFKINAKGLEEGQSKATIIVCKDAQRVLNSNNMRGVEFKVKTTFNSYQNLNNVTTPPYNPFMIVGSGEENGKRTKEVHLPNFAPTDLVDMSLFNFGDDKSNPENGKYYISDSKFPFAIQIPVEFAYPDERTRIDVNYPKFVNWVNSDGAEYKDWYKHKEK